VLQAKKHLWQNFLKNTNILDAIVWAESLENKNVIEVWPGLGDLTAALMRKKPKNLTLIELDTDMLPLLSERFGDTSLHIVHNDVLWVNIQKADGDENSVHGFSITKWNLLRMPEYIVYGNIPYYITSPILHHFLYDVDLRPSVAVFTMQKEVADRILAHNQSQSVLSLACQLVATVQKICDIHPNNFTPVPKVWSTCLRFELKKELPKNTKSILLLIKQWFSQKRKKLINNLIHAGYKKESLWEIFWDLDLSENIRPEQLTLANWRDLHTSLTQ
jgi:16S rRNA (adenine1518-N6/adenine1519-N6)-dimethyltransferase